jgi:hypothetical protein
MIHNPDPWRGFETRTWKAHGITHSVHRKHGIYTSTMTECGVEQPNLPWRNTSRFSLEKINCMACIAAMSKAS